MSKIKKFNKAYEKIKSEKSVGKRITKLYKLLNEISSSYKYRTKKISSLTRRIKLSIYQLEQYEKKPKEYKKKMRILSSLAINKKKLKKDVKKIIAEKLKGLTKKELEILRTAAKKNKINYYLTVLGKKYIESNVRLTKKQIQKLYNDRIKLVYEKTWQWIAWENLSKKDQDKVLSTFNKISIDSISVRKGYYIVRYSYRIYTGLYFVAIKEGAFTLRFKAKDLVRDLENVR